MIPQPPDVIASVKPDALSTNPRFFAVATGAVLMVVGGLLVCGICLAWSFTLVPPKPAAGSRWVFLVPYTSLFASFIGAMFLFAAGVGLYGERPSASRFAVCVTGGLFTLYAVAAVVCFAASWSGVAIAYLILGGFQFVLLLLSMRSSYVMGKFPPPQYNVVTDEWLQEQAAQRKARRDR